MKASNTANISSHRLRHLLMSMLGLASYQLYFSSVLSALLHANQLQVANAQLPAVIDLATLNSTALGVEIQGAQAFGFSGASVSGAGDVNGDGFDDVIIGADRASPQGRTYAGTSYLIFGRNAGWPATLDLAALSANEGVVIQGAQVVDASGQSVSAAGDINNDGIDDLIIGALWADPQGRTSAGSSYLIFGRTSGWPATMDLAALNATDGVVIEGAVGSNSGVSVSRAGDMNGDGLDDVIVGAYRDGPQGRGSAGSSYVIFGRDTTWPATLDLTVLGSQGVWVQGAVNNDRSGGSVSAVGDINGDGLDDAIIGVRYGDPQGRNNAGISYLVFGRDAGWPATLDLAVLSASEGVAIHGAQDSDVAGWSVSNAGDVNGDGFSDVIIGGFQVDPLGRSQAGSSYLIFGRTGWPATLDLAALSPSDGVVIQGGKQNDNSGRSVSSAGDVNGDGIDDFIIGAHRADPQGRNYGGISYVIFGSAPPSPAPTPVPSQSPTLAPTSLPTQSPSAVPTLAPALSPSAASASPSTSNPNPQTLASQSGVLGSSGSADGQGSLTSGDGNNEPTMAGESIRTGSDDDPGDSSSLGVALGVTAAVASTAALLVGFGLWRRKQRAQEQGAPAPAVYDDQGRSGSHRHRRSRGHTHTRADSKGRGNPASTTDRSHYERAPQQPPGASSGYGQLSVPKPGETGASAEYDLVNWPANKPPREQHDEMQSGVSKQPVPKAAVARPAYGRAPLRDTGQNPPDDYDTPGPQWGLGAR